MLTVSDTRSIERTDRARRSPSASGVSRSCGCGARDVTDDVEKIRAQVQAWIADPAIDVVITTGGTGFTGRDVTPEALEPLLRETHGEDSARCFCW